MTEWAEILRRGCEDVEPGLADALGLKPGLSSEEFERVVGEILALQTNLPLLESHLTLGGLPVGSINNHVEEWRHRLVERLGNFEHVLRVSLYEQFGVLAIDKGKSARAVRKLMEALHGGEGVQFATTNYDRTLETGLTETGVSVKDGFRVGIGLETPKLAPEGLSRWAGEHDPAVSVLHLHGAVGWYANDEGEILGHYPDQPFNPTLGTPAILPPDPNKDPLSSGYVRAIWSEFRKALSEATHVLIIGHSLHDAPLLAAFREEAGDAFFAISFHEKPRPSVFPDTLVLRTDADGGDGLQAGLNPGVDHALQFQLDFSETADMSLVDEWVSFQE